jgi:riboflavin kinase/FMN adenylyltransferase
MEFIRNLHNFRDRHRGCVATIGNFDGVHLGHQSIIRQLKAAAGVHGLPTVIVTFEPHPQEFFAPEKAPARLMRLREKLACLKQHGIDRVVCLRFDHSLANLSAGDFIRKILVDKLGVRHLIVGDDFRFGKNRQGDIATLKAFAQQSGFEVEHTDTCIINGRRVSSTWLRELLAAGKMTEAAELLGRPYTISGRVVHGDKRGRGLGYPTININLHRHQSPVAGIFAANVYGLNPEVIPAAVSIGSRPVFEGRDTNLEAHLLDFDREVYGAYVTVELLKQLRHEEKFGHIDDLKAQMDRDIAEIRKFFRESKIKM